MIYDTLRKIFYFISFQPYPPTDIHVVRIHVEIRIEASQRIEDVSLYDQCSARSPGYFSGHGIIDLRMFIGELPELPCAKTGISRSQGIVEMPQCAVLQFRVDIQQEYQVSVHSGCPDITGPG